MPLSKTEERKLVRKVWAGDSDAFVTLFHNWRSWLTTIAFKWRRRCPGVDLQDLIQCARIGVYKACLRFDMKRGTRFMTYAYFHIQNEMRLHCIKSWQLIPELKTKFGSHQTLTIHSMDSVPRMHSQVSDDRHDRPYSEMDVEEINQCLLEMDQRSVGILRMRSENMTLAQIGVHYGISRERVRQLEVSALKELTDRYTKRLNSNSAA